MNVWITWALFATTAIYSLLDAWHTVIGIKSGYAYEANPVMSYLIEKFGLNFIWTFKITGLIILALLLAIHQMEFQHKQNLIVK